MPIDIKVHYIDGSNDLWIAQNSERIEKFIYQIPGGKVPINIEIDPENWILCKVGDIILDSSVTLDTTSNPIIPQDFKLYPVYPNPFNSEVTFRIDLDIDNLVNFSVYNISGKKVWQQEMNLTAGSHSIKWNGKNSVGDKLPSGNIFC